MPKDKYSLEDLPEIARQIRLGIIKSIYAAGSGHPAGALGLADVLTVLYFMEMNVDPGKPDMPGRDRFILSPAHMAPGLYSTLANRGYFPVKELKTLREFGSKLQGHTFRDLSIGVETTGGSLGQGLSIACGFALAARMDKETWRTYCVISDGEMNEGQTWEALMFSVKEKLDNLCIILDCNGIQLSGNTVDIMPLGSLRDKLEPFGFNLIEIDGHNFSEIAFAFGKARLAKSRPTLIISRTTAGKGVSFMENKWEWHGKAPSEKEYNTAVGELGSAREPESKSRKVL